MEINKLRRQAVKLILFCSIFLFGQCSKEEATSSQAITTQESSPAEPEVWVFLMAGQSNMAGRDEVEKIDSNGNQNILSINEAGEVITAKEPLHFYEPDFAGLDCGLSFAQNIIDNAPDGTKILMIPTAVGGSRIDQWIDDEEHRGVKLLSNFESKAKLAREQGIIKGILWHQGEGNANSGEIENYQSKLATLFTKFRNIVKNEELTIMIGELGSFSTNQADWDRINSEINNYANTDDNAHVISTEDFNDLGDDLHFNSAAQRKMGERFALEFLSQ